MIWMVDKIKSEIPFFEGSEAFRVPVLIEIEYGMSRKKVDPDTISRKIHYNRPVLVKHIHTMTHEQIDSYMEDAVSSIIAQHLHL